ncbi:extracellular solute-binding protein [Pseudarthrobacter sp. NamE2]|uniref:extracellular solute-binding protein n=1 Tax=Pseudarthrobacter sp. NamE2 TaxID=2576838 RepID=UPI0010FF58C9|nr:extracellular solute-binding protein [Pseudarthrobacter sp. NamE2]TLM86262.1 extracellular solute-binding protein [Pseudarthrobacter sp. NamE2]
MKKPSAPAKGLVAAAAALGLVTGCTPGGDTSDEAVTELNLPAVEAPWLEGYKKVIADYESEKGIKINLTSFPFDGLLTQEANAAQSGSNAFDLFLINEQWVGQFYDNEWVQPLTDVNSDFEWDENLIEFAGIGRWDADARSTTPDGTPYSLPINGNIHEFMYRTDLYQQLGLNVPTTWDDVVANGNAAKAAGAVGNGFVVRGKTPSYDFSALLYSYGGKWFEDETGGNWKPAVDSSEFRQALTKFKELADIGPAAPQTIAQAEAISLMQSGDVLQTALVTANAVPLENPAASRVAGKIGYAKLPGGTPVSGTWTMGVPTGLPDNRSAAAYDFLTWLTSKDTMQKWEGYGGVTTRADVTSQRPELQVLIDSEEDIRGGLRYPFTPALLDVTDPAIGEYLAGTRNLEDSISVMQDRLTEVVEKAGFLK